MARRPPPDTIPAEGGPITVSPITHGTVEIAQGATVILVDPVKRAAYDGAPGSLRLNYDGLPAPTLILVTDIHTDHEDASQIAALRSPQTIVVIPRAAAKDVPGAVTMNNGQGSTFNGVKVETVPMYNLDGGFHTRGRGNGYVVTLGGKRIYFAGDTDCTPEMKMLPNIDVAFLPMNLPYTMPPARAAAGALAFKPRIVYPYHYKGQDVHAFESALRGSGIEVRLRDWYIGAS